MSPIELTELKRILADLEKKGLIVPTSSPYGFPILFIRHKTSGKLRMCCDFRSLNKISISQRTPISRIDECLNQLHGSQFYSQIDLTGAFNQTRLSDSDSAKCVISHRYGQHRFLVTPFGLKNSGAYFQGIINETLKSYIDKFCLVYLDDILIYSKTEKEHKEHVKLILQALDDAKFVINIEKSHFNIKDLTFLGFQVSRYPRKVFCHPSTKQRQLVSGLYLPMYSKYVNFLVLLNIFAGSFRILLALLLFSLI